MPSNPNQRGGSDTPEIFIEGIEKITKRDLAKHKALIVQTQAELDSYRTARAHEVQRKRHYRGLIGGGKFNDDSLRASMKQIGVNIRHMSDRVSQAEEKLKHHQEIVATLTAQLEAHEKQMLRLCLIRAGNGSGR